MSERLQIVLVIVVCAGVLGALANAAIKRRHLIDAIDPGELTNGARVVLFTSPYCHGCKQWSEAFNEDSIAAVRIDISERPDAAARYRISSTPRVVVTEASGKVLKEFHHYEPRRSDLDQIIRLAST